MDATTEFLYRLAHLPPSPPRQPLSCPKGFNPPPVGQPLLQDLVYKGYTLAPKGTKVTLSTHQRLFRLVNSIDNT